MAATPTVTATRDQLSPISAGSAETDHTAPALRPRGRRRFMMLAAAGALSIASCGGGDDTPAPSNAPQIPKTRLIAKADAICRTHDKQLTSRSSKLRRAARGSGGLAVIAPYLELNAETIRTEVAKIIALGTPSADVDVLHDYLDQRTTVANALRFSARAARAGDLSGVEAAAGHDIGTEQALAKRFGFKDCGLRAPRLIAPS